MIEATFARSRETRLLFRVALVIFSVTVGIGIFNGFHFITLSRAVLLTHVHSGTLGWITLTALAAAYWLYSDADDRLARHGRGVAIGMAVWVPLYVLAFLSGNSIARAVFGTPVLLLILGIVAYLLRARGTTAMSVPRLGVMLAFVTLVIGSTLGVLVQIQLAVNHQFLPEGASRAQRSSWVSWSSASA
jgi:cbb3-type cytochrome oxidase subunit 1